MRSLRMRVLSVLFCYLWVAGTSVISLARGEVPLIGSAYQTTTYTGISEKRKILVHGRFVWAATRGGLARWDIGSHALIVFTKDDGLPGNDVVDVEIDSSARVWVSTTAGASRLVNGRWEHVDLPACADITVRPDGTVLAACGKLRRFDGAAWHSVDSIVAFGVVAASDTTTWVDQTASTWGSRSAVVKYGSSFALLDAFSPRYLDCTGRIKLGEDGSVLVLGNDSCLGGVSSPRYLTRYIDGRRLMYCPDNRYGARFHDAVVSSGGDLYLSCNVGIVKYSRGDTTNFSAVGDLVYGLGAVLDIDSSGALWAGTRGGFARFDGSEWETFAAFEELTGNLVNCFTTDSSGGQWFGTSYGLARESLGRWQHFTIDNGLGLVDVGGLTTMRDGTVIAVGSTPDRRLVAAAFEGGTWRISSISPECTGDTCPVPGVCADLYEDGNGQIWLGWYDGHYRVATYQNATWSTDTVFHYWFDRFVESADGQIWISEQRFSNGRWIPYGPEISPADSGLLTPFLSDADGTVWFGSYGMGVFTWKNDVWRRTTWLDDPGVPAIAFDMLRDRSGRVVAVQCNTGPTLSIFDGLTWSITSTGEGVGGWGISLFLDAHGMIWVNTLDGTLFRTDGATWGCLSGIPQVSRRSQMHNAADGSLLLGTRSGAYRLSPIDMSVRRSAEAVRGGSSVLRYCQIQRSLFVATGARTTPVSVSVYSVTGRLMLLVSLPAATGTCRVSTKELPAGTYVAQVVGAASRDSERFVVR